MRQTEDDERLSFCNWFYGSRSDGWKFPDGFDFSGEIASFDFGVDAESEISI